MADIDLDARRKLLKAKTVRANGHTYTMPVYLPATILQVGFALAKAATEPDEAVTAVRLAYASVFGEEHVDQAMADISLDEFQSLTEEAYKVSPGGISGLAWTLEEHWNEAEADFQRFYGLDLNQALWGESPVGLRRVIALLRQLPPEGALWTATRNEAASEIASTSTPETPAPKPKAKVVTSLSGVDPRMFYSGELTWN